MKKMVKGTLGLAVVGAVVAACSSMSPNSVSSFKKVANYKMPTGSTKLVSKKNVKKGRGIASDDGGLTPNNVRYKDTGAKPETGRAGGNSIMTRALRGKDGNTLVEVTTGTLAVGPKDGSSISKIQFKMLNADGKVMGTENYTGLDNQGYFSKVYDKLVRHQKFTIQANMKIDTTNRNYVVESKSTVYLRPDLAVNAINSVDKAKINQPITINAEIAEMNGDVSAAADCVLKVNGAEVVRSANIWVDHGDNAVCTFQHSFATAGQFNVSVELQNVNPGDFDLANNSKSKSIEIVQNNIAIQQTYAYVQKYSSRQSYEQTFTNRPEYSGSYNYSDSWENIYYQGVATDVVYHGGEAFSVKQVSGAHNKEWIGTMPAQDGCNWYGWHCYWIYDYESNRYLQVQSNDDSNQTWIYYQNYAGKAVYWAGTGAYAYLNGYSYSYGDDSAAWGSNFNLEIALEANGTSLVANENFPLTPWTYSYSQPQYCYNYYWYYGTYCYTYSYDQSGVKYYSWEH